MFEKILVANRGEIAVRVIRACRELGIVPVAVYSDPDRDALHVRLADQAFRCGPARAADSYLSVDALVAVAEEAGVSAVHPGYGFLSENGEFAEACRKRGIGFIGPSAEVLRSMGDKVESRRIMQAAGVPVVPGSSETLDDAAAAAFALEIGLPVMVKATSGGGGRGLRLVAEAKDLPAAIERSRSEAGAAFSNDGIYIEKVIDSPRHIEVQILADQHGNVVHLFERECSIQRRHQKLVEEAPANGIGDRLRAELGAAAVEAARAVDYVGAGTVEFLVDREGHFYFLEMNTRVQVEHPVTELVTSTDIVKEMIRIAAGEPLRLAREAPRLFGNAIEARIYAEDPDKGFLPSPGVISIFRPPDGPGIRVDAGVQAGDTVTPHYDALLAKVIAWAPSRDEAIARLERALGEFAIGGVKTSIPFHQWVVRHPAFLAGEYDTGFVAQHGPGERDASPARERALQLALATVAISRFCGDGAREDGEARCAIEQKGGGRAGPFAVSVDEAGRPGSYRVEIDGTALAIDAAGGGQGSWSLICDREQHEALLAERRAGRFEVRLGEDAFLLQVA